MPEKRKAQKNQYRTRKERGRKRN